MTRVRGAPKPLLAAVRVLAQAPPGYRAKAASAWSSKRRTPSSSVSRVVFISRSGAAGGSYGAETPVNSRIASCRALRYRPLGSRASQAARSPT